MSAPLKSNHYCSVPNCGAWSKKFNAGEISFHRFPHEKEPYKVSVPKSDGSEEIMSRRRAWAYLLKITRPITPYMVICSQHFTKNDYFRPKSSGRGNLKRNAVPSQNLPLLPKAKNRQRFNIYCCVPTCNSWSGNKNKDITYHLFPDKNKHLVVEESETGRKSVDYREAWIEKLKINKPVSRHMKVCSSHFTKGDFLYRDEECGGGKILKKRAVPSQNLPSSTSENASNTICDTEDRDDGCSNDKQSSQELEAAESLMQLLSSKSQISEGLSDEVLNVLYETSQNQEVLPQKPTIDLLKTDTALQSITGLNSFKTFRYFEEIVKKEGKNNGNENLTAQQRIILTLVKIKLDLSFDTIASMFSISRTTCETLFYETISILYEELENTINFEEERNEGNIQTSRRNFEKKLVALSSLEILMESPGCSCCTNKFYSRLKSNCTVKFMIASSPTGIISFISESYGGKASDERIFKESRLIDKLTNKHCILVKKGFFIEDLCASSGIKIIRPPFTKEKASLRQKAKGTKVHIDIVRRKIKSFKLLNGKLEEEFIPKMREIFLIVCWIINSSSSL